MNWLNFQEKWAELEPFVMQSFPNLGALDLSETVPGTDAFVAALADTHDLTHAETHEALDDIALNALSRGLVHVSEVTQRMVASS